MIFECDIVHVCRRSRLGAWIEILKTLKGVVMSFVAPVWERGLKSDWRISDGNTSVSLPFGSVD